MPRRRRNRLLARTACLVAAVVLLWPAMPWEAGSRFVSSASPFVAVSAGIATRSIGLATGLGLAFTVLAVLRRRWFCRYVCPTGLVLDGVARAGPGFTAIWSKWPPLGQYAVLITLAGALAGYPVLLWLDPIAIFSSPFAGRGHPDLISGLLAGICLGILLPLSFLSGTVWCVRLCPLGGLQDMLGNLKTLASKSLDQSRSARDTSRLTRRRKSLARRAFLSALAVGGLGVGAWGRHTGIARAETAPLRPPGAITEDRFTGICIRCGNCSTACPAKIIHPDRGLAGTAGLLAPTILYNRDDYCREDCLSCTQVCPSGALQVLDLRRKQRYIIGEALVDTSLCLTTLGRKDCDACVVACPYEAVEIHWDDEMYVAYPVTDPGKCNGCGACEVACPTEQVKAISVWPLLNELTAKHDLIPAFRFLQQDQG